MLRTFLAGPAVSLTRFRVSSVLLRVPTVQTSICAQCSVRQVHTDRRGSPQKYKRNTFGSNEYRKKRSAARRERLGLDAVTADVPIQSVTDPLAQGLASTTTTAPAPVVGLDANFPSFGKKYVPATYIPMQLRTEETIRQEQQAANENWDEPREDPRDKKPKKKKRAKPAPPPLPVPDQSTESYVGGAFGRADAYRVPGMAWGGSYKNPESYESPTGKSRRLKREREDQELEQLWEKQDREREEKRSHQTPAQTEARTSHKEQITPVHEPLIRNAADPMVAGNVNSSPFIGAAPSQFPVPGEPGYDELIANIEKHNTQSPLSPAELRQGRALSEAKQPAATAPPGSAAPISPTQLPAPKQKKQSKQGIQVTTAGGGSRWDRSETEPTLPAEAKATATSQPAASPVSTTAVPSANRSSPPTSTPELKPLAAPSASREPQPSLATAAADSPITPRSHASLRERPLRGEKNRHSDHDLTAPYESFARGGKDSKRTEEPSTWRQKQSDVHVLGATAVSKTSISASTAPPPPPPSSAAMCCGCGAAFQSSFLDAPGFLPPEQLEKYVGRRTKLFQERLEQEKRKREIAAAKEQAERREREQGKDHRSDERATKAKVEQEKKTETVGASATVVATEPIATTAASNDKADSSSPPDGEATYSDSGAPFAPPSSTASSTLQPDFHRFGKLDPSRPLKEQDLTLALNRGLIDTDTPEALLALGIPPEFVMTKRELNQLEREEKEQVREVKGESALRCLRCFQLANYGYTKGQVQSVQAEDFSRLLRSRFMERGGRSSVILKVVDLFDFHGSFIKDFTSIVGGRNPIILVVNKMDLFPDSVGENRLRAWIKAEAATRYGLHFHSIELVSAVTGQGLWSLIQTAKKLAEPDVKLDRPRRDIYIVGTTNVGKSSIVNKLIEKRVITSKGQFEATKIRVEEIAAGGKPPATAASATTDDSSTSSSSDSIYLSSSSFMSPATPGAAEAPELLHSTFNVLGGKMTASIVPGTTLGMVSFPFVQEYDQETGKKKDQIRHILYDTPGVINPEQISNYLTFHELKDCMPRKQVQPITYRIQKGQCLLLGGLARMDFVDGERDYCFFTVFASRNVTVHITQIEKMDTIGGVSGKKVMESGTVKYDTSTTTSADDSAPELGYLEFIKRHGGTRIYPPFSPERCKEIGLHSGTRVAFDLHGRGWLEACEDIVFPGLGWISVTGSGQLSIRAILPGQTKAHAREPIMPFEAKRTMKKFTGSAIRQH